MRPAWNDEEALIDYVVQAILDLSRGGDPIPPVKATGPTDAAAHAVLNERRDHQRKAVLDKYGLTESPFRSEPKLIGWDELESELVPIAESGNYAPLFRLLRIPAARAALKESTWQLIVAIGSRQHKPKGRRRQTKAERFNAATVVAYIGRNTSSRSSTVCYPHGIQSKRRPITGIGFKNRRRHPRNQIRRDATHPPEASERRSPSPCR